MGPGGKGGSREPNGAAYMQVASRILHAIQHLQWMTNDKILKQTMAKIDRLKAADARNIRTRSKLLIFKAIRL